MKKFKLLSIFLISGMFLLPSTLVKADSRNNTSEDDLIRLINTYNNKEIILEDGISLFLGEKLELQEEKKFNIDNPSIIEVQNGEIVAKNIGSTFVTQELDNKVYILEFSVSEKNLSMYSRDTTSKKTVDRDYYKVFIDPGHGGYDNGAVQNGFFEDEINLKISKKVEKILSDKGIKVMMSRYDDRYLSLSERTTMANKEQSDIFVSIHQNSAASSSANGIETFYYQPRLDSKELATDIQDDLINSTNATNRGVKAQNFAVIKTAQMSSSLVECGFISNLTEGTKLNSDSYQNTIAKAIANGIVKYLEDNITLKQPEVKPEVILREGTVITYDLNLRTSPSYSASTLGTIKVGSTVSIIENLGEWSKIKYNNSTGYVLTKYIECYEPGTVITYDLNLRTSPSYSASTLGVIKVGSSISLIENLGEWSKIKYNNSVGYVLTKYIQCYKLGTVITYDLNVRTSPSYSASTLGVINVGSSISVMENLGEWSKIKFNNSIGYILTKYIKF